ncbi:MAG: DUF6036 family nucleotidyltransferase [Candidatus Dormibacteria bacterium]
MFDRDTAMRALGLLADDLASQGLEGRLFVVGGAALALAYDARRTTRDVDAVFEPKPEIYAAARRVARDLGLPDDWINDAVKGFVPGTDPDAMPIFMRPGLAVTAASAQFLLAMKLRAARVEQDADDIGFLVDLLNLKSVDAVLEVARQRYREEDLPARARFLVEQLFDQRRAGPPV